MLTQYKREIYMCNLVSLLGQSIGPSLCLCLCIRMAIKQVMKPLIGFRTRDIIFEWSKTLHGLGGVITVIWVCCSIIFCLKTDSVAWVRERTIPTERPPLVGEVNTDFYGGCHVVRVADRFGRIIGFLDRSRYFFFQVAPQLYSRGWVDLVPGPLLLRKSGSAGNRTQTSGSVVRNSDHWATDYI
jgi:hypothetical protein